MGVVQSVPNYSVTTDHQNRINHCDHTLLSLFSWTNTSSICFCCGCCSLSDNVGVTIAVEGIGICSLMCVVLLSSNLCCLYYQYITWVASGCHSRTWPSCKSGILSVYLRLYCNLCTFILSTHLELYGFTHLCVFSCFWETNSCLHM